MVPALMGPTGPGRDRNQTRKHTGKGNEDRLQ